eukprot:4739608-Alexandrium_andersonii.AAC.1
MSDSKCASSLMPIRPFPMTLSILAMASSPSSMSVMPRAPPPQGAATALTSARRSCSPAHG